MNWFIIALVFHVLRLNLCVALSQVCPDQQYLSAGICVNCTVCQQPGKNVVLRPCTTHADTICGSVSDVHIDLPGIKINSKYKNDISNRYLTINSETNLSKENITAILKKLSESEKSTPTTKDTLDINSYNYYDDDSDEDDLDYSDSAGGIFTAVLKRPQSNQQSGKKSSKKAAQLSSTEPTKIQLKKDYNNVFNSKYNKPVKFPVLSDVPNNEAVSVMDPDTLFEKTKRLKKLKFKDTDIQINDHSLKIANTQFKVGSEKSDDGRWLELSHPHIVDKKIFVDLMAKDKKGSTFFNSGEKQTDQEYAKEMTKLLNETSAALNENHSVANQANANNDDFDSNVLKNLDDDDDDSDDDDDDDDDDDEDDDDDDDEDEDGISDDDEPFIYNDFGSNNGSDRTDSVETQDYDMDDDDVLNGLDKTDGAERLDFDKEDDIDLHDNDLYEDRTYMDLPDLSGNDIIAEPFVSSANWQILILVAAMSACLLFFVVVSAYICIYMRKKRHLKTTFIADVEDLSSRVNLIQHVRFEGDDSSNMRNYISQLRGVKSHNEKLPKIYIHSK